MSLAYQYGTSTDATNVTDNINKSTGIDEAFTDPKMSCSARHGVHEPVVDPCDSRFWGIGSLECWKPINAPTPAEVYNDYISSGILARSNRDSKYFSTMEHRMKGNNPPISDSYNEGLVGFKRARPDFLGGESHKRQNITREDDNAAQWLLGLGSAVVKTSSSLPPPQKYESEDDIEDMCECGVCEVSFILNEFRIDCGVCDETVHGYCVGIMRSEAADLDVYVCPMCEYDTGRQTTWLAPLIPAEEVESKLSVKQNSCDECKERRISAHTCRSVLHHSTSKPVASKASGRAAASKSSSRSSSSRRKPVASRVSKSRAPKPKKVAVAVATPPVASGSSSSASGSASSKGGNGGGAKASSLKGLTKRCFNCKVKQHFSTEKCRKILNHTAPAWDAVQ